MDTPTLCMLWVHLPGAGSERSAIRRHTVSGSEVADLYKTQAASAMGPYALLGPQGQTQHARGGGGGGRQHWQQQQYSGGDSESDSEYRQGGPGAGAGGGGSYSSNAPGSGSASCNILAAL